MDNIKVKEFAREAIKARKLAYTPYSNFNVGAALLTKDGSVYIGANLENAAYTPSICAERSAFVRALIDGHRQFEAIFVAGGPAGLEVPADYCAPCGVCRQVMREFAKPSEFKIYLVKSEDEVKEFTLEEMLPLGFGPEDLGM